MEPFTCFLPVKPTGKGRPRFVKKTGRAYTPDTTLSAEAEIRFHLVQKRCPMFEGAVSLSATIYLLKPKSAPKNRLHPVTKPDLDNYIKLLCDSLNGLAIRDDAQICAMDIAKIYGNVEGIRLSLEPMREPA